MTHLITDDEYVCGVWCVPPLPRGRFSSAAAVVLGFSMSWGWGWRCGWCGSGDGYGLEHPPFTSDTLPLPLPLPAAAIWRSAWAHFKKLLLLKGPGVRPIIRRHRNENRHTIHSSHFNTIWAAKPTSIIFHWLKRIAAKWKLIKEMEAAQGWHEMRANEHFYSHLVFYCWKRIRTYAKL